jgi:hypothetical protein
MFIGRCHAGQVRRVDDQHRMELETDRGPRLHVAHACQQERGQNFCVGRAAVNPGGHLFQQPIARRLFQQPHQRFDLRPQLHDPRVGRRFGGRDGPQGREES